MRTTTPIAFFPFLGHYSLGFVQFAFTVVAQIATAPIAQFKLWAVVLKVRLPKESANNHACN
jgi:hypothetical protein